MARHQKIAKLFDEEFWGTQWRSQVLLRFLSRNFNVFSFITNPPQKSLQNCLYQRYNSAANTEKFFNILEFIYYVSFYSHVCTNYFWFVPSLTLFRTYLVQVYNIMRNVTTFLKVIFVHFSKDNETVSFIKLLDFGLSQGRVSAVSIKCVVICSKFITFAVTKTTAVESHDAVEVLWFAQNSLPLR